MYTSDFVYSYQDTVHVILQHSSTTMAGKLKNYSYTTARDLNRRWNMEHQCRTRCGLDIKGWAEYKEQFLVHEDIFGPYPFFPSNLLLENHITGEFGCVEEIINFVNAHNVEGLFLDSLRQHIWSSIGPRWWLSETIPLFMLLDIDYEHVSPIRFFHAPGQDPNQKMLPDSGRDMVVSYSCAVSVVAHFSFPAVEIDVPDVPDAVLTASCGPEVRSEVDHAY